MVTEAMEVQAAELVVEPPAVQAIALTGPQTPLPPALPLAGGSLLALRPRARAVLATTRIPWTGSWVAGKPRLQRRPLQQIWLRPTLRTRAGREDRRPQESSPQQLSPKFLSPRPVSLRQSEHERLPAFLPGLSFSRELRAQPVRNLAIDLHRY